MENHNIKPEKITKPIQLLAVWLIGLILIVSALLTAAGTINQPSWLPAFFSISAVCIIPLFLALIFLLQTRFRPQMQEDEYYSKYLNSNTLELESNLPQFDVESLTNKIDEKLIELSLITKNEIQSLKDSFAKISPVEVKADSSQKGDLIKFDKFIKDSKTTILINTKLDKFEEIVGALGRLSIRIDRFFGNSDRQEVPAIFLLSFGKDVDFEIVKILIFKLKDFGLMYISNVKDAYSNNNLYVGSYGYKKNKIAQLDETLLNQIMNSSSLNEIIIAVQQKEKKYFI